MRTSILIILTLLATQASAGTIRHDRLDSQYTDLAASAQFAATGIYGGCSATLIDAVWAVTAAHCSGAGTFTIGGQSRSVVEFYRPSDWNGDINDGNDIAVMKLSAPITTVTPADIYRGSNELDGEITMVGFGRTGTGKSGSSIGIRQLRAGTNVVDAFGDTGNGGITIESTDGPNRTLLLTDFDAPLSDPESPDTNFFGSATPLDLEYQIAPGDSGGAGYVFENGEWYLAGIHSGDGDFYDYPGAATNRDTYGDLTAMTRVSSYTTFIDTHVPVGFSSTGGMTSNPEPSSLLLMGTALAGGLALRRRRKRRDV